MVLHRLSSAVSRLEALKKKYTILDARIDEVRKRPFVGDFYLTQLKKQRLLIREEIEDLSVGDDRDVFMHTG